jgi:hypothetical protein
MRDGGVFGKLLEMEIHRNSGSHGSDIGMRKSDETVMD